MEYLHHIMWLSSQYGSPRAPPAKQTGLILRPRGINWQHVVKATRAKCAFTGFIRRPHKPAAAVIAARERHFS